MPLLVVASGFKIDFQQGISIAAGNSFVRKDGFLRVSIERIAVLVHAGNIRFVLLLVANQVVLQSSFGGCGSIRHDCPIGLFDFGMRLEHVVESRQGFACAGKEHYPTRRDYHGFGRKRYL